MEYLTDRNEPQRRHWAILITIALHLALGIAVYMSAEQQVPPPAGKVEVAEP